MLDVVTRFATGFIFVPCLYSLSKSKKVQLDCYPSRKQLEAQYQVNIGPFHAIMRAFKGLGWLEPLNNVGKNTNRLESILCNLPGNLKDLIELSLHQELSVKQLTQTKYWFDTCAKGWNTDPHLAELLDGLFIAPILVKLNELGGETLFSDNQNQLDPEFVTIIEALFLTQKWATNAQGFKLNSAGQYMLKSGAKLATVVSYRPMLAQIDALLYGDSSTVFSRDSQGAEMHLDRARNVEGSGAQHGIFFNDIADSIVNYFNELPLNEQPKYIADMGCGDGTLLKTIYLAIINHTERGKQLDIYPLTLIGVDLNEASIKITRTNLKDFPNIIVTGDINSPKAVIESLKAQGVSNSDEILHVRSFLDHDRGLGRKYTSDIIQSDDVLCKDEVHITTEGNLIQPEFIYQRLVAHLLQWQSITGRHGIMLTEVHSLSPRITKQAPFHSESIYFDTYHALSGQQLVNAATFTLASANAGLWPVLSSNVSYPRNAVFCRISSNHYLPRPYYASLAKIEDIDELAALELTSLGKELACNTEQIRKRIKAHPAGQLKVVKNGKIIAAVYSQRISDPAILDESQFEQLESLHTNDGEYVQLLGLVTDPCAGEQTIGTNLLQLALSYFSVTENTKAIVGVTRCGDFETSDLQSNLTAYVQQIDSSGLPIDPILRFHANHGAEILRVIPNYRPVDTANLGAGVLICYTKEKLDTPPPINQPSNNSNTNQKTVVIDSVRKILGSKRQDSFELEMPFMEMGLNSLELLELRLILNKKFNRILPSTLFFEYPTTKRLITFFVDDNHQEQPVSFSIPKNTDKKEENLNDNKCSSQASEGIAIVGFAGRFPGSSETIERFKETLNDGINEVSPLSSQRQNDFFNSGNPNDSHTIPVGGFLQEVSNYDSKFFRTSPREAELLDPQQRLLMEMVWTALEDAAIDPNLLAGSKTGTFLGLMGHDYETLLRNAGATEHPEAYFAIGTSAAIAAGRIAYFLDLHGPAITIDTACSSSLVAIHQACRSLEQGECKLALSGGVNLILLSESSDAYREAGMLAEDNCCKTFDASANGYVRGEGCGVLVLKRMADAHRDGDRIRAIIRGTSINQDGASASLTAPNQVAQESLISEALQKANLPPSAVMYLEAHGTGTSLGDPIEVQAAAKVLGKERAHNNPLLIGSVKTNIGHLEAAAGIAGLIKTVISLNQDTIPKQLHFQTPNPLIPWAQLPVKVVDQPTPWPKGRRIASVSSFGFSGTNAHVVLEAPPTITTPSLERQERSHHLLTLSAKTSEALKGTYSRYIEWLEGKGKKCHIADVCYTAGIGRSHFTHRAAIVIEQQADSHTQLLADLQSLASGEIPERAFVSKKTIPKLAMIFTGQGSQYLGMAQGLYANQAVFRETINRCATLLDPYLEYPLTQLLFEDTNGNLNNTSNTQPALFALEVSLYELYLHLGIVPDIVLGHSVGEYAAAYAAGIFSLEEGCHLISTRAQLMGALPNGGGMAAVFAPSDVVEQSIIGSDLSIAAFNGSHQVVSGTEARLTLYQSELEAKGIRSEKLEVSHAFHSSLIEPMLDDFSKLVDKIEFRPAKYSLVCNLNGKLLLPGQELESGYWIHHTRKPVQFADSLQTLADADINVILEIGPRPVLAPMVLRTWPAPDSRPQAVAALKPGCDDVKHLTTSLAKLYVAGITPNFSTWDASWPRNKQNLPNYPFQRQRYWYSSSNTSSQLITNKDSYLGHSDTNAHDETNWTRWISPVQEPWLIDYQIFDNPIVPWSFYASFALATQTSKAIQLNDLSIEQTIVLDAPQEMRLVIAPETNKTLYSFACYSRTKTGEKWQRNAIGTFLHPSSKHKLTAIKINKLRTRLKSKKTKNLLALFSEKHITIGPRLTNLVKLHTGSKEALGEVHIPKKRLKGNIPPYPMVLESCFQIVIAALAKKFNRTLLPVGWKKFQLLKPFSRKFLCHAKVLKTEQDKIYANLCLYDKKGQPIGLIQDFVLEPISYQSLIGNPDTFNNTIKPTKRPEKYHDITNELPLIWPEPSLVVNSLKDQLEQLPSDHGIDGKNIGKGLKSLNEYAIQFLEQALLDLGWQIQVGERINSDYLHKHLGVVDNYQRLSKRLLEILENNGMLVAEKDHWRVVHNPRPIKTCSNSQKLETVPELQIEQTLLERCGQNLAAILRGEVALLSLLFPPSDTGVDDLYRSAPSFCLFNNLMGIVVAKAVNLLPEQHYLRILEIGAGTGSATASVLPHLPLAHISYTYTDMSPVFFGAAETRFAEYNKVISYQVLNIERDPMEQGFKAGSYDLIIASNALHATIDIEQTIAHCRSLCASGGLMIILEGVHNQLWMDVTFGPLPGWRRFKDQWRNKGPLIGIKQWKKVFKKQGFILSNAIQPPNFTQQAVLITRANEKYSSKLESLQDLSIVRTEECTQVPDSYPRKHPDTKKSDGVNHVLTNGSLIDNEQDIKEFIKINLQQILRLTEPPGNNENFYDLGLDSLMAVEFRNRLLKTSNYKIELKHSALFSYPSINLLSAHIQDHFKQSSKSLPVLKKIDYKPPLPLSFAQNRLWFLSQLEVGSAYNIPLSIEFVGDLNIEILQQTLNEIVARHEILRTRFVEDNEIVIQKIAPPTIFALPMLDVSSDADPKASALALLKTICNESFDLSSGPLWRAQLVRLNSKCSWLTLAIHHIVFDGWSIGVFHNELKQLYGDFSAGRTASLYPLPIQYKDFTVWQRNLLQGDELETQLNFWRNQLKDAPLLHHLPLDYSRPKQQRYAGHAIPFSLDASLTQELHNLSQTQGTTLFMSLLTAFTILLSRHGDQQDWIIGTPIANRLHPELEGLIGFFVNTLPLRIKWEGDPSYIELLGKIKEVALGAYAHQNLPFERLVENLNPERSLSHEPIVQILFALQDMNLEEWTINNLTVRPLAPDLNTTRFELECHVWEVDNHLEGYWTFNTELFDKQSIELLKTHFSALLHSAVAAPEARLSRLSLWGESEKHLVISEWNATENDLPKAQCVHHLFELQAKKTPEAIALIFNNQQINYQSLNHKANKLAHSLISMGIKPDVPVGLCVKRSPEMIIGVLGILKAGGTYMPLDPEYPEARLTFMLEDAQVPLILSTHAVTSRLQSFSGTILYLDEPALNSAQIKNPSPAIEGQNLMYILYTSGSTGYPKGVCMSHEAFINLVTWQKLHSTAEEGTRTLQYAPISFDVAAQECFSTWATGGTLILIDDEARRDPITFLGVLEHQYIERLFLPYVALTQLAKQVEASNTPPTHLKEVITAGEQLRVNSSIRHLFEVTGAQLVNQYGPTETHVVTANLLEEKSQQWSSLPSIGQPIANTKVYILDAQLQPQPIGVLGELCIAGKGLARGYLNHPDLTAEKFIDFELFGKRIKLYRTGDLARWRPDGKLEFLGRTDQQVKIRGFRVEPGEIETLLNTLPGVEESIVIARGEDAENKRLVAYLLLDQKKTSTFSELRQALGENLPDYMLPSAFVPLDALPLTSSGKINYQALPPPAQDRAVLKTVYEAPRTSLEHSLAKLWQEILMLNELPGIYDNFFELGGHSLLSARLTRRIESEVGRTITLTSFFNNPTIAGLSMILEKDSTICSEPNIYSRQEISQSHRFLNQNLLQSLRSYSGSWQGERANPDSLIIGHNLNGTRAPLFWVLQGQHELLQLAHYMGPEQPLYGMRSGHLIMDYTEENIQALALDYAREIEELCPQGPLVLGGNCQGALIALAIAQHLLRRERHIPLLILMEWSFPAQPYAGHVGLIFGEQSTVANPYLYFRKPGLMWQRVWPSHQVKMISGSHGQFFFEPNIQTLAIAINQLITGALKKPFSLLPAEGRKAQIIVENAPEQLLSGELYLIKAQIINKSSFPWPGGKVPGIFLINQWCDNNGNTVVFKDNGIPLPGISSGEKATIFFPIRAPESAKAKQLVLKIMEEGVITWFNHSCDPLYIPINITPKVSKNVKSSLNLREQYQAPIIIGGTGGSGTRVISKILQDVGVFLGSKYNNSEDSIEMIGKWWNRLLPYWNQEIPEKIETIITNELSKQLTSFVGDKDRQQLWGWKLPPTVFFTPFLHRLWPEIRCIHLVRDGRDIALSRNQNQLRYLGPVALETDELLLNSEHRSIRLWEKLNLNLANYAENNIPEQYLRVRYEDLCTQPEIEIKRLLQFLNIEHNSYDLAKRIQNNPGMGRWQKQSATWLDEIEEVAKPGLTRFGYLDDSSKQNISSDNVHKQDVWKTDLTDFYSGDHVSLIEKIEPLVTQTSSLLPTLADAFYKQEKYFEAEKTWRQAIAINRENEQLWLGLGRTCNKLGKIDEAIAAYFQWLNLCQVGEIEDITSLIELLKPHKRVSEIIPLTNKILKNNPKDTKLLLLQAEIYLQLNDFNNALATARLFMQLPPKLAVQVTPIIWKLYKQGRPGDVRSLALDFLKQMPSEHTILLPLAYITLYSYDDARTALLLCNRGLEHAPQYRGLISLRGQCLTELGKLDEALIAFNQVIEKSGDEVPPQVLYHRGRLHRKNGKLQKAIEDLRHAVSLKPDAKRFLRELAEVEIEIAKNA